VRGRLETARGDFGTSAEAAIARWFPTPRAVPGDWIEKIRAVLLANDRDSYLHAYEVFASGDRQISPKLPLITAPTLAVTGGEDSGSTPEMTRRLADAVPRARAVIVPEARHMLPMERPFELAGLIAELIDDAERTATRAHPA
jgi:pimeloyl-ACP methyl ester carboxylesterase